MIFIFFTPPYLKVHNFTKKCNFLFASILLFTLNSDYDVSDYIIQTMEKGTKVLKAQAVPFILINQKKDSNGRINYEFELQRKAVEVFMAVKNKKIAVATVAGPQRSGKSFLSNRLLKRMTGFAIGPSTMPCTKGLWIWGEPIQINEDTVLIIMDTQGLNSVQRDINVDLKIFSLSVLLSSVFIYNSLGHIDEKALQNMSYVLRITQNIRMKSESQGDSEISKCFPFFYWVLRDFSLDLKGMSQSQYLQKALTPVSNDQNDPKNQIRSKIRKLFTQRRCECFPRPINEEDKLAHIEDLQFDELRQKFRDKMKQFERTFYDTLPTKIINGKPLTGEIYLNLIRQYIDAMNQGKVPEVLTSLERVLQCEARQITQSLMTHYRQAMGKFSGKPYDENLIQKNHRSFMQKIEIKIDQKLKNWLDMGRTGQYKAKLIQTLEKDYKQRIKKNNILCTEQCSTEFTNFSSQFYELPKMENLDLFSDSFFKEKINQYSKYIQPYFEQCKSPRKYLYFMEKFPKSTIEYFQLFFARAKGIFNNEINKLKAEFRNSQAQIGSLNRIMKEQENLLDEKQKEVDALTHQNDVLRREYKKNEEMKDFLQKTEEMGKNQLKKTLQAYKLNILDLENAKIDLQEQLQKLKVKLSSKDIQISQMSRNKIYQPSADTESTTDLPNDLFSMLKGLKEKLTTMKEFYDSSITDDSIQEKMLSEIDSIRAQKFKQIEKIKQKNNEKIADLRNKFGKAQIEYEKNMKLLNLHIDDLKTKNMDLEKAFSEISERKGGNFSGERKNLEESIRLKQNNINSLKALLTEKDKKVQDLEYRLASLSSENAIIKSYKETFMYIFNETLKWMTGKSHKMKHSISTLTSEDEDQIKKIFKEVNLKPPL